MSKKIAKVVKLELIGGEAKPGPKLASAGIVMPKFCTDFNAKTTKVGHISKDQLRQIAEYKMPDLNCNDVEAAMRIVAGSARNMGIVIDD